MVCFVREPLISLLYFTVTVDVVYTECVRSVSLCASVRACVCQQVRQDRSIIECMCVRPSVRPSVVAISSSESKEFHEFG